MRGGYVWLLRIAGNPSYALFAGAGEEIITGFGREGVELITTTRLEIMR
jgi:hypothetical protein